MLSKLKNPTSSMSKEKLDFEWKEIIQPIKQRISRAHKLSIDDVIEKRELKL